MPLAHSTRRLATTLVTVAAVLLGGCAGLIEPRPNPAQDKVVAVTADGSVFTVSASWPWWLESSKALSGLPVGETLIGLDTRPADGQLYALGRTGQLYTLDVSTATLKPVGTGRLNVPFKGVRFGMNFDPASDRVVVVSDMAQNLRLHPETGEVVDFDAEAAGLQLDPALVYAPGDIQHGQLPKVAATAYAAADKASTGYGIDLRQGMLVTQGSVAGETPAESATLGILRTVGELGTGALVEARMDISATGVPLVALRTSADDRTRLYRVNLTNGQATLLGTLGQGKPVVGMAILP